MSFSDLIKSLSKTAPTIFYFVLATSAITLVVVIIKFILGILY